MRGVVVRVVGIFEGSTVCRYCVERSGAGVSSVRRCNIFVYG